MACYVTCILIEDLKLRFEASWRFCVTVSGFMVHVSPYVLGAKRTVVRFFSGRMKTVYYANENTLLARQSMLSRYSAVIVHFYTLWYKMSHVIAS